jgi:hypothetical protein
MKMPRTPRVRGFFNADSQRKFKVRQARFTKVSAVYNFFSQRWTATLSGIRAMLALLLSSWICSVGGSFSNQRPGVRGGWIEFASTENFPDKFFEFRQRVAAAIWPPEYDELKRSTFTLAILLHQASAHFLEHAEENHGYYSPHRFYKAGGHNPNYDKDLAKFEAWLEEFYRLIKEATKAANWFAEVVLRDVNPLFFIEAGKFFVIEGPFSDLKNYARIPEFDPEEKGLMPSALFKSSLVSN